MTENRRRDDQRITEIHACLITGLDGKPGLIESVAKNTKFRKNVIKGTWLFIGGLIGAIWTKIKGIW